MQSKRKYFGRIQVKENTYGEIIKIGIGPKDFELLNSSKGETGWVTVDIKPRQEGGYYGEIYEPQAQGQAKAQVQPANTATDDLF